MKKIYQLLIVALLLTIQICHAQPSKLWTTYYSPFSNGHDYQNRLGIVLSSGDLIYAESISEMVAAGSDYTKTYLDYHSASTGASTNRIEVSNPAVTPYYQFDNLVAIDKDASDNVYVAGKYYYSNVYNDDAVLVKYNSSLVQQWRIYGFSGINAANNDYSIDMLFFNNNIYWLYYTVDYGYKVALYNSGTGSLITSYTISTIIPKSIKVDPITGDIYLLGTKYGAASGDQIALQKLNSAGTLQWNKYLNVSAGVLTDVPGTMAIDNSENIIFTGYGQHAGTGNDIIIAKYNNAGTKLWSKVINGTANQNDTPGPFTIDAAGNIYAGFNVTDNNTSGVSQDILIRKYSATGTSLKTAYYKGSGNANDAIGGLKIGPNGRIYMAGVSATTATSRGVLAQYDTDLLLEYTDITTHPFSSNVGISNAHSISSTGLLLDNTNYKAYWLGLQAEYYPVRVDDVSKQINVAYSIPTVPRLGTFDESTPQISLFPNPANNFINIQFDRNYDVLEIYNITGEKILQENALLENETRTFITSMWKAGLYLVKCTDENGETTTLKFVKEN